MKALDVSNLEKLSDDELKEAFKACRVVVSKKGRSMSDEMRERRQAIQAELWSRGLRLWSGKWGRPEDPISEETLRVRGRIQKSAWTGERDEDALTKNAAITHEMTAKRMVFAHGSWVPDRRPIRD